MSELALQLIKENKRTKDTFLDLGNCGLEYYLPEELLDCVWLKSLNLGQYYYFTNQNDWIQSKNTQSLNRFNGQELNKLRYLPQLNELYLYGCRIQDISFLENLTQLQSLNLGKNTIRNINSLKILTQLQTLDISRNKINDISTIRNLIQLESLNLSYNQIQDFHFLENFRQLQFLNLSYNKVLDIRFLKNLTKLQYLNLHSNELYDIHFLENLIELQYLYLGNNKIQNITFLQNLSRLQFLDLSNNQIKDSKSVVFLIEKGLEPKLDSTGSNGVFLQDNPVAKLPTEIMEQGKKAIIRYFNRIGQQGPESIFEAKLNLVGNGGAGKTSLQRRILDTRAALPAGEDRTKGIKIHDWQFNDANGNTYTGHVWDFGGHDVYHPVHRFFLTENSVYVLMASNRHGTHNFDYWVPTIYQFGGSSPIIPVQIYDNSFQKDWTDIKPFYENSEYNLKPVHKIDLSSPDNWGLKKLKGFIKDQITELPLIRKTIPKSWVKVRVKLAEKAKNYDFISFKKFSDLCCEIDSIGFSKNIDIEDLAHFLHDSGIVLWFQGKDILNDFIILKHEWFLNAIYKVLDDRIIQEQNGTIYQADFNRIWGEKIYRSKITELKKILEVFRIAFPKQHQKHESLLPLHMQPIPQEKLWQSNEDSLILEYNFEFIPPGIVNQLSVILHDKILSDESLWNNAFILKYGNSIAQIVEETQNKKILITAEGNKIRELMLLIRNTILNIIEEYKGIKPLYRLHCPCDKCQILEKPTIFENEELLNLLNEGRKNVTCNKSNAKLSILQLLDAFGLEYNEVQEKEEDEEEEGTLTEIKSLQEKPVINPKKVFVTYCQTDKDGNNDKVHQIKVLSLVNALRKRGFDATFDKALNDLSTANDFMNMKAENIKNSDKVVIVLSEGYAIKADNNKGGVGAEYELVLSDITQNENKYVLVTLSGINKEIYPLGLKGRDTIDLSKLDPNEPKNLIRKLKGLPSVILEDIGTDTDSYNPTSADSLF